MRISLLSAITTGAHAADHLSAAIKGRAAKPLSFAYYGQGIALGPDDAVSLAAFPNDMSIGPIIRGRPAVWIWGFFVWLILYLLELERRLPGLYFWLGRGRYAARKRLASRQAPEGVS